MIIREANGRLPTPCLFDATHSKLSPDKGMEFLTPSDLQYSIRTDGANSRNIGNVRFPVSYVLAALN